MLEIASNYSTLISKKKILNIPTCILLESMATAHGHLAQVLNGQKVTEDMLEFTSHILQRALGDIKSTRKALSSGEVNTFPGDWRGDRYKAAGIFSHLIMKGNAIHKNSFAPYRQELEEVLWRLKDVWEKLFMMLDGKYGHCITRDQPGQSQYLHGQDGNNWLTNMAKTITSLNNAATYGTEETYLILLCFERIKTQVVEKVRELENKNFIRSRLDQNRIICVSDHKISLACPKCMKFTENIIRHRQAIPRAKTNTIPQRAKIF